MKIVTVRRITQAFFLLLVVWLAVVATVGTKWWQMRGWPIDWLLQLDPLVAMGTLLSTHTLYAGLVWAAATVILTILLGRFFCGWVCPLGTMQQIVGLLGQPQPDHCPANRQQRLPPRRGAEILRFGRNAGGRGRLAGQPADRISRSYSAGPTQHNAGASAAGRRQDAGAFLLATILRVGLVDRRGISGHLGAEPFDTPVLLPLCLPAGGFARHVLAACPSGESASRKVRARTASCAKSTARAAASRPAAYA